MTKQPIENSIEREIIEDLVWQYAIRIDGGSNGIPCLNHGYLSAMEQAFDYLGYEDYHEFPEMKCEHPNCNRWQSCGMPTKDGYKKVCGDHFNLKVKE